jgi:hypothetical protein
VVKRRKKEEMLASLKKNMPLFFGIKENGWREKEFITLLYIYLFCPGGAAPDGF